MIMLTRFSERIFNPTRYTGSMYVLTFKFIYGIHRYGIFKLLHLFVENIVDVTQWPDLQIEKY